MQNILVLYICIEYKTTISYNASIYTANNEPCEFFSKKNY